jgi:ribosomal protein S18 acetylase RimI-like enzyme
VRLSVLHGSPAQRLYERLGFTARAQSAHATSMQVDPWSD